MAIAEMRKLRLVGMSYDKDDILNALQKTQTTEIKFHADTEDTVIPPVQDEELTSLYNRACDALNVLSLAVDTYNKDNRIKSDVLKDGFEVTLSEFMDLGKNPKDVLSTISKIETLNIEKASLNAKRSQSDKEIKLSKTYSKLDIPFSYFSSTKHTETYLGVISTSKKEEFINAINEVAVVEEYASENIEETLISVSTYKDDKLKTEEILSGFGFVACPYLGEKSGKTIFEEYLNARREIEQKLIDNEKELSSLSDQVKPLKIYCDYLSFMIEKEETNSKMRATKRTILLEGYVPKDREEIVKNALDEMNKVVYYEFVDVPKDEIPPTLMKNNKVTQNFEAITNMYSVPNSKEFDPTTIMAFFYSLFMGFIMGDIGYGIVMILGGGFVWLKQKRDTGLKRLAGVFSVGGLFAIVWGILFNSLFGQALPGLHSVIKTYQMNAPIDMWTFVGINIPSVLIISLLIGVVQLFAGYVCKGIQNFRRKQVLDGILDGLIWALFSVGVFIAIVGLIKEANVSYLAKIGGIIAGASLLIAVLTAGRKEKLFGKFTKGFGAAYGIISYASDILSYARLYGLMLSGAVIAQIVSQYAIQFITGGNVIAAIFGVLLMVAGHLFNLAISLLGAYIHDARLQYVEFYGRFYEGDGELFTPLGSQHNYIYLTLN